MKLLGRLDFRETYAHPEKRIGDAHRAKHSYLNTQYFEDQAGSCLDRIGCAHFYVTSVETDVGQGAPDAHFAALRLKLGAS